MALKISLPILTFLIAFLGGLSNSFTDWSWYESLEQSSLRPPNYIFGIVWPILYTLMAAVSFLQAKLIYKTYIAQLILNGMWSWIFFAHQALTLALFNKTESSKLSSLLDICQLRFFTFIKKGITQN